MASRVSEIIYKLRDLFTAPARKIKGGYDEIRGASKKTAKSVARDNRKLGESFDKVEKGFGQLLGGWRGLAGAISAGAIVNSFDNIARKADQIGKAASKIGLSSEALSKLAFAAEKSGVGFNSLEIGLQRMTRRIGDALNGSTELRKVFERLGLDVEQLAELNPEDAFLRIADAARAVGNEREQLSSFIKIFDSEGANLIRVARQGSAAIRELGLEAEELGAVFGSDFVANAERYTNAVAQLDARLTGTKINAFTPILEELTEFLDNVGLGDRVKGLTTELLLLEQRLEKPFVFNRRGVEKRVYEIKKALNELEGARRKDAEAEREQTEAAKERQAQQAALINDLDQLTLIYEQQAEAKKDALAKETAELRQARTEQARIETEFENLVEGITAPDLEDIGLGDVFAQITRAAAAASEGQSDQAIKAARRGGELLEALKDKGEDSDLVLQYLARRLQTIANEAAAQRTEVELLDVTQAEQALDGVKNKLEALKSDAAKQGAEFGRAFVTALEAELEAATITAPTIEGPALTVQRRGNEFFLAPELEKRGNR